VLDIDIEKIGISSRRKIRYEDIGKIQYLRGARSATKMLEKFNIFAAPDPLRRYWKNRISSRRQIRYEDIGKIEYLRGARSAMKGLKKWTYLEVFQRVSYPSL
jgi:aspartate carbamoyltransferase catalytic subunit